MNAKELRSLLPLIYVICGFVVVYSLYICSLFKRRKDGNRRRWRGTDTLWVPLAGLTGIMLLILWWYMRQLP
jgi:amino acid transporter